MLHNFIDYVFYFDNNMLYLYLFLRILCITLARVLFYLTYYIYVITHSNVFDSFMFLFGFVDLRDNPSIESFIDKIV